MKSLLVKTVRDAGIVGAGGAGFPSHVKYNADVEFVIANGAECEPLLYCDQIVMKRHAKEIVEGLKLVMKGTGAGRGFIALKAKYHDAVEALKEGIASEPSISLHLMGNFYPAGDEQVIVNDVTGRIVPEGGIPLNVGVVVANISSLLNVARAFNGEPVTSRWLTVNGAVSRPYTAELPIGVTFREAIDIAGGPTVSDCVIISGGPMMGKISGLDSVVSKTTSGILVFPSSHPHIQRLAQSPDSILRRTKSSCDQCMACTEICPRFLMGHELRPHMVMRAIAYGLSDSEVVTSSFLCCECGVCSYYACPLFLSPGTVNAYIKSQLAGKGVKNPHNRRTDEVRKFRKERLLPIPRLVQRIGLASYAKQYAPFEEVNAERFLRVSVPLKQHIGVPSVPVIKAGISVGKGSIIAEIPQEKLGARIHAPISGTVIEVSDNFIVIQR